MLAVFGWLLARAGGRTLAARAGDHAFGWPFVVATAAGECTIYAGVAAGGQAAGWPGMWSLGAAAVIAVAIADLLSACSEGALPTGSARWPWRVLAPPAGTRVLLAASVLALRGPRLALFSVLAVGAVSVCAVAVRRVRMNQAGCSEVVRAGRDDGAVAGWAGRLVQGTLAPLPAAVAGTAGTVLLAALGLSGPPGFIALAPVVVLTLAAPGSGHPHNGRYDWLVPAVMALGQFVYLASLGFARAVPGPAVFALCAVTVVWYAGLAASGRARRDRKRGLGWEERLLIAGISATFGIATVGYVGLATYLAVLIGRQALAGAEDAVDRASARRRGEQAASSGD